MSTIMSSNMSEELVDVKCQIRATLISANHSNGLTVNELYRTYQANTGEEIPFRKFNFRSLFEFLRSIPDTVQLSDPDDPNTFVKSVSNEKTQHIERLVREQNPPSKKLTPRYAGSTIHRKSGGTRRFQRQRPILNNDFKKDVFQLLLNYPKGMSLDTFDSHVQRILANHHLNEYSTEEVLNNIAEFAFRHIDGVFLNQNRSRGEARQSDSYHTDNNTCVNKDIPSGSSSVANRNAEANDYPFANSHLRDHLQALLADNENTKGIWLTDLTKKFELKYGYPLAPKNYGFFDVMHMVTSLKTIFHVKQDLSQGADYLLLDARKFARINEKQGKENGFIPKTVVEQLKKMLKHGHIYADDLSQEYERTYQRKLCSEEFGFRSMDSFLQHLEGTCPDIVFRQLRDRISLELINVPTTNITDTMQRLPSEVVPGAVTYDPFPPEVCNADFRLEIDPDLAESKKGQVFAIDFTDVQTPRKFHIMHMNKVKILRNMMTDLNEFYNAHELKYRASRALISRKLLCACRYSVNSEWHRARVISCNLKHAKICFIDYGTVEEEVNIEELRYLHKDFAKYPALCMLARLSDIQPKDGDSYSQSACCEFYQLIADKDVEAEVVRVTPSYLEILLHVQMDDTLTSVREVLLQKDLVKEKCVSQNDERLSHLNISHTYDTFLERLPESNLPNEERISEEPKNDTMTADVNSDLRERSRREMESNFSWSQNEHNPLSSVETSTKLPPGIQFSQLHPNQSYADEIQTHAQVPHTLYQQSDLPHSYYNGVPIIPITEPISVKTMYSAYLRYPTHDMSEYGSFRPPPGIKPLSVWESLLPEFSNTRNSSLPPAKSSSTSPSSFRKAKAYDEACQTVPHSESKHSYACESCPTNSTSSPPSEEKKDTVKKMLDKLMKDQCPNTPSVEKSDEVANIYLLEYIKSLREKEAAENRLKEYLRASEYSENADVYSINSGRKSSTAASSKTNAYAGEFIPKTKPKIKNTFNDNEFTMNRMEEKSIVRNILNEFGVPFSTASTSNKKSNFFPAAMPNRNTSEDKFMNDSRIPFFTASTLKEKIVGDESNFFSTSTPNRKTFDDKFNSIRYFVLQHVKNETSSLDK